MHREHGAVVEQTQIEGVRLRRSQNQLFRFRFVDAESRREIGESVEEVAYRSRIVSGKRLEERDRIARERERTIRQKVSLIHDE